MVDKLKPLPPVQHTGGSVDPKVAEMASTTEGAPEVEAVTRAQAAKSYVPPEDYETDPRVDVEAAKEKAIAEDKQRKADEESESASAKSETEATGKSKPAPAASSKTSGGKPATVER
jgi:hypothetical protein